MTLRCGILPRSAQGVRNPFGVPFPKGEAITALCRDSGGSLGTSYERCCYLGAGSRQCQPSGNHPPLFDLSHCLPSQAECLDL